MKPPNPRKWTDPRTGKIYYRVRTMDADGRSIQRAFSDEDAAEKYCKDLSKARERHGRAAAIGSDEIDALRIWREYVSAEQSAGHDVPALRDVIRSAIGKLKDGGGTPALRDLHDDFIEAKENEDVSRRHLAALKNRLKRFMSYIDQDEPSGSVTTQDVEKVMTSMKASGMAAQTVKGIRAAAHGMFQWAMDRDQVAANPVSRAKAPKVKPGEVGTITASQLKGLLRTTLKLKPVAVPSLAVWAFCGVRRSELCCLRYEDIDLGRKELRVSASVAKTGVVRFVPIPDALIEWLEAAKSAGVAPIGKLVPGGTKKGPDGQKIPDDSDAKSEGQLNRWLRELRPLAGIDEWPTNALRHSFASHACALHEDFAKVATWIGHARDPGLLVARYRHAVPKTEGEKWFEVLPVDPPKKQPSPGTTKQRKASR